MDPFSAREEQIYFIKQLKKKRREGSVLDRTNREHKANSVDQESFSFYKKFDSYKIRNQGNAKIANNSKRSNNSKILRTLSSVIKNKPDLVDHLK